VFEYSYYTVHIMNMLPLANRDKLYNSKFVCVTSSFSIVVLY